MRIAIFSATHKLFGTDNTLAVSLLELLSSLGHQVERVTLPFVFNDKSEFDQLLMFRLIDLQYAELVISLGFPASLIVHPNKFVVIQAMEEAILPGDSSLLIEAFNTLNSEGIKDSRMIIESIDAQNIVNTISKVYPL
jgi:hypothetical protein